MMELLAKLKAAAKAPEQAARRVGFQLSMISLDWRTGEISGRYGVKPKETA